MRSLVPTTLCLLVAFTPCGVTAQSGADFDFEQAADYEYDDAYQAREQQAEANFDAIMIPQNAAPAAQPAPPPRSMNRAVRIPAPQPGQSIAGAAEPAVEVPLGEYKSLRDLVQKLDEKLRRRLGPAVVLGSAEYNGRAIPGALSLQLKLQVTLGQPGLWKTIPLIGDDVVLVTAKVDGQDIPVSRRNGFHVWVTRQVGDPTVVMDVLVPSRGPRGSIEYDFLVARTPVTSFSCFFRVAGLEPRLDKAVRSKATPEAGGTRVTATLRPTTRIHLVGFRDLSEADGAEAKVIAETMNLLSLAEGTLELFTVIQYTILYAGKKEFHIQVPPGLKIVTVDGKGAFRYDTEESEAGTLIKGETAFPIRNQYEISLRLRRESPKKGETFEVPLTRCLGVERENGWLGVEVPGKLLLKYEGPADDKRLKDMRLLPEDMIRNAVSPIRYAFQYHIDDAQFRLTTTKMPEKKPVSGSIDRIHAFTTVNKEGNTMTDMRITMRNRFRHTLALTLPAGTRVLSTHRDGAKVKPSLQSEGRVLLPLLTSKGGDRLQAFTLSVVLEGNIDRLGLIGFPDLQLPAVDLPVSSLAWSIYLPARNIYTTLAGDIEPQVYAGRGSWHRPATYGQTPAAWAPQAPAPGTGAGGLAGSPGSAHSGAMPVRIELPEQGTRLEYARYWLDKDHATEVSFVYARFWLTIPVWMLLACVFALGILLVSRGLPPIRSKWHPWIGGLVLLAVAWPLYKLGRELAFYQFPFLHAASERKAEIVAGFLAFFPGLCLGFLAIALRRRWHRGAWTRLVTWWRSLPALFKDRQKVEKAPTAFQTATKVVIGVLMFVFALVLLDAGLRVLLLLTKPLG